MNGYEINRLAVHVLLLLLPWPQYASCLEHLDVSISFRLWALSQELEQIPMHATYDVNVLAIFFGLNFDILIHFTFGFYESLPGCEMLGWLVCISLTSPQACQDFLFP